MSEQIRERALSIAPATATALCREVYERFSEDRDLLAIPVVENGEPVGLVNRQDFMLRLADQFGRALFEGKAVTHLMETKPLIVEAHNTVDFVGQYVATERPSALLKGFIIVENGHYFGVVSGLSLLQATVARLIRQTQELEQARETAELASRSKSTFLATVSHELRTPLNAIIGFANFILTKPFGAITPTPYQDYVQDIATSGEHLLKLINDILDMSRVEAGRLEIWPSMIDPVEIIQATVKMLKPQLEAAGHELGLDLDPAVPDILADERALKQIFLNLFSNAIKFTPPGGRIAIAARMTEDGHLDIEVRDDGIGIAEDKLDVVMTPFGQIDSSLSRKHAGTGLGLPLVKAFAEAHGGHFRLESAVGRGTAAIVTLPAAAIVTTEVAEPAGSELLMI